jgi:acyl-CoA thioester hydrolase
MDLYASKLSLRIDWNDIDQFGHVNNVSIIRYVQSARIVFMEELQILPDCILAASSTHFFLPLFYPGNVVVYSRISMIKNTSFILEHSILNGKDELSDQTTDVVVYFDYMKNQKRKIDAAFSDRLRQFDNRYSVDLSSAVFHENINGNAELRPSDH